MTFNALQPKTYESAKEAATRRTARRKAKQEGKPRYGLSKSPRKPLGFSGRKGKRLKPKIDRKLVAWSKAVRERDDYTCQKCGRRDPGIVVAHHVAPRGRRRDLKYELSNGVTLCEIPCHQWVHAHPLEATAIGLLSTETFEKARKAA